MTNDLPGVHDISKAYHASKTFCAYMRLRPAAKTLYVLYGILLHDTSQTFLEQYKVSIIFIQLINCMAISVYVQYTVCR
jgi:hypothetical protein